MNILSHFAPSVCIAAAAMAACGLHAQEAFPKRSVTIVVPYAAGGVTDHFARVLGNNTEGRALLAANRSAWLAQHDTPSPS